MEAERLKYRCSLCVADGRCVRTMRHSIDFNDQLSIECDEIDNKAIDWMLPAKLPTGESTISQRLPQACFGTCLGLSQLQRSRLEPR